MAQSALSKLKDGTTVHFRHKQSTDVIYESEVVGDGIAGPNGEKLSPSRAARVYDDIQREDSTEWNGWLAWYYYNGDEWVPIDTLRD
jgi:hypothetical protein